MWKVEGSGVCSNIEFDSDWLLCDVGFQYLRLVLNSSEVPRSTARIELPLIPELLQLRQSVLQHELNPAVLADALEENREHWTESNNPELILQRLRECW